MDEQTGSEGPRGPIGTPPRRPGEGRAGPGGSGGKAGRDRFTAREPAGGLAGGRRPGRWDGGDLKDTERLAAEKEAGGGIEGDTAQGGGPEEEMPPGAGSPGGGLVEDRPHSDRPWNERLPQSMKVTPGGGSPGTRAPSRFGGNGLSGGWGGTILVAVAASLLTALVVLIALPAVFGVNPYDLVRGKLKKSQDGGSGKSVEIVAPVDPTDIAATARDVIPSVVNVSVKNPGGQGLGSGVIYRADGHIITSNTVIAGATEIAVTLANGESLLANLVGTDPRTDVAVLKIDRKGLPPIVAGDSTGLAVGRQVVAVYSPSGFRQTVASGIVSALHRNVTKPGTRETLTDLIQVDMPVDPGGAGGALCDTMATFVGMNTIVDAQAAGQGAGFAVPVTTVKAVADDIIKGRPVAHPYIGVFGQSVDETLAIEYQLPVARGALVTSVVPGSPADVLGIKPGDVIIRAAQKTVKSMDGLTAAIREHEVGETIVVTYYQGKNLKTTKIKIEETPPNKGQTRFWRIFVAKGA